MAEKIMLHMVFETRDGERIGLGAYQNIKQAHDKIREREELHADATHDIQLYVAPQKQWHG